MDISLVPALLRAAYKAQDSVLLSGKHGIGKSTVIREFCEEEGFHFEPLFLSHQEVCDLIGSPYDEFDENGNKYTTWTMPIWLKRMKESNKPCVLLLDELNRAQLDVLQSALQLSLEGRLHEHELPRHNGLKTLIVAAINPSDDYQVNELDPALLDRFLYVENLECSAKTWLKRCRKKNTNAMIQAFITEYPDRLHCISPETGVGTTPRSWTKLAEYIDNIDEIDIELHFPIIRGKLGASIGAQFITFMKNYVNVIKVEDIEKIVEDNRSALHIEEISDKIYQLNSKSEAIQKTELLEQLGSKYLKSDDMFPLLAYLYSLEIELCVGWLKSLMKDDSSLYRKLAEYDNKINSKKLFSRIIKKSSNAE